MTRAERDRILNQLDRGFMRPEVVRGDVWEVVTTDGTTYYVPADVVGNDDLQSFVEGTIDTYQLLANRWMARLSAPGYLDCTEWDAFPTMSEALYHLAETYGD